MPTFASIDAFLTHLGRVQAALPVVQHRGQEEAGAALERHAKALIGSEYEQWAALADSTVARKQARGQTGRVSATDPLYATGELRATLGHGVEGNSTILGSPDPVAPYLEFGTERMPARAFIGSTMFVHGHDAADLIAGYIMAGLMGRTRPLGDHARLLTPEGAT